MKKQPILRGMSLETKKTEELLRSW